MIDIAVVLTCHNRKEKTLKSLRSLINENSLKIAKMDVFLCDDGSTDGTSEAVLAEFPETKIVKGSGNLFWTRGMAKAMSLTEQMQYDYFLMINDDVFFKNDAIEIMLNSYYRHEPMSAITGATQYVENDNCSYGGVDIDGNSVTPYSKDKKVFLANWNCFLIPKKMYDIVGKIDETYEHSYGDFDYSQRIHKKKYNIYISEDYVGRCDRNGIAGTWMDRSLTFRERMRALQKPTGIPIRSQIHYYRKYHRKSWLFYVIKPYLVIFRDIFRT